MSDGNPLVAGAVDTATPFSGTGLLDSGTQLAAAVRSGDWVAGGMAAFGTVMDAAATAMDPLGSLFAAGLGWLMDHLEPLKGWLNDLTGDAGEVQAFAQTWANIATQLQASGDELVRILGDLDEQAGEAIEAYRRFQTDAAAHLSSAAGLAGAMSTGLSIASTIVQVVHELVRDVISQLVGSAISWAAQIVFTVGLGTPWVISQVCSRVASLAAKVGSKLTSLIDSIRALATLLDKLKALLSKVDDLFRKVLPGGSTPARRTPPDAPASLELNDMVDFLRGRGVSPDDIEALRYYTTDAGYSELNGALRGPGPVAPDVQVKIDAAVRAMDALPDHAGPVYRGETIGPGETWLDDYQPGNVVQRPAFTSADLNRPFPGNVQYVIESQHGKSIGGVSVYYPGEVEVLFRPGSDFIVVSRTDVGGVINLVLRERT